MNYKSLFKTICFFAIISLHFTSFSQQPNIVLVLVDDMGIGDPQVYNAASKIPTPFIDELATQGMLFTDAHTSSSVCTPARYSILTGDYAWRTRLKSGVLGPYNSPLIDSGKLTIPKMLSEKGYETALVGKWHLGMQWATTGGYVLPLFWGDGYNSSLIDHTQPITAGPLTAGFDYFFGVDVPNFPPYIFIENDQMQGVPTVYKPSTMYGYDGKMLVGWELSKILPTITQKAVDYIDNYATANSGNPFFLQVTTTSPHAPIIPAAEFIGASQAGPYGDLVNETDATLGAVKQALEDNGLLSNTIIILTSDNGSPERAGDLYTHEAQYGPTVDDVGSVISLFGHYPNGSYRGRKADIWEGGHRVPFIVSWPGNIPANSVSNEPICSADIIATLASIVNYSIPSDTAVDSEDLSDLWTGAEVGVDYGKTALKKSIIHHSVNGTFAVRKGKWKLILAKGSGGWSPVAIYPTEGQLYDLDTDPYETTNLYAANPLIVDELEQELINIRGATTADYPFNTDNDAEGWIGVNGAVSVSGGNLTFSPNGGNTSAYIKQSTDYIDFNTYRYVHIRVSNQSNTNNWLSFSNAPNGCGGVVPTLGQSTSEFTTYVYDLQSANATCTGGGTSDFRIYIRNSNRSYYTDPQTLTIDYIKLSNSATILAVDEVDYKDDKSIVIYPNPVNNMLNIMTDRRIDSVEVYNSLGQKVLNQNGNSKLLDTSPLSNGFYILKIHQENDIISTKRFIKQ